MTPQSQALTSVLSFRLNGATTFTLWGSGFSNGDRVTIGPVQIDADRFVEWNVRSVSVVPNTGNTRLSVVATPRLVEKSKQDVHSSSDSEDVSVQALGGDLIGDMNVTVSFVGGPTGSVSISQVGFA